MSTKGFAIFTPEGEEENMEEGNMVAVGQNEANWSPRGSVSTD